MTCAIQYKKHPNKVRFANTERKTAPHDHKAWDSDGGGIKAHSELKLSRFTVWRSRIQRQDHSDLFDKVQMTGK